uniref:Glycosyltransferase family 92 protein n=1 Tax=Strigamia maritima TaxID=126957 RepID=T1J3E9_STRMM
MYNHSTGPNVHKVLQLYQSLGIVTVLSWQIDIQSQKQIRTEAMFASMNDCLYRTMFSYSYTIFIDFDEYIVPKNGLTYAQMMSKYENHSEFGSFVFHNTFFYLYHGNNSDFLTEISNLNLTNNVPYLITLFKTNRTKNLNSFGQRSKYIVRPEYCILLGNHLVWTHFPGKRSKNVKPDVGLSHHYRICENGGFDCLEKPTVFDNSTWYHAQNLISNVTLICQQVYSDTGQCPEAPTLGSP